MKWILMLMLVYPMTAFAGVPDKDAIDAIVGEAANQDGYTKICIAQAIDNRGNLKGVFGYHAPHNKFESADTFAEAATSWYNRKKYPDQVNGATNFGTKMDLAITGIDYGEIKAKCGDFYFY